MAGEPIIKLDAGLLGDLSAKASGISTGIDTPVNGIANILGALDWKVKSQSGVEYDLKNVSNEFRKQQSQLDSWKRVIVDAIGRIDTTTSTLNAKTDAIAMQAAAAASRGADVSGSAISTAAAAFLAAALLAATKQIGAQYTTIKSGIKEWFSNIFHTNSQGTNEIKDNVGGNGWCDQYRNSVVELDDGRLMVTDPDGNVTIMTQDEYKDYCGKARSMISPTEPTHQSGPMKSYKYNDTDCQVVAGYKDSYALYQQDYNLPKANMKGTGKNTGCNACCACMAYNIRNGTDYVLGDGTVNDDKIPEGKNFLYLNDPRYENCNGSKAMYSASHNDRNNPSVEMDADSAGGDLLVYDYYERKKDYTSVNDKYQDIKAFLSEGRPVTIKAEGKWHYLLVVGIKENPGNPLSDSDFLVVDPATDNRTPDGNYSVQFLSETNYKLGSSGSIWGVK